ncbi:lipopolysaccharide biosynthesis protein [Pedobacter sp. MC2016-14]|uniref:lipopolysaccharide biosynthesis protein n=1 Tax=Pedobacter sp. MC2016-14 TaxID=2897327 RepID=UPI001E4D8854|nr:lipopolysaccharide biosynthesis protein [Pedobacter sp. MC2016-14]MCD0490220.1 lipopolysaccharide biosynthesis protein [Pedobacter sp. MC2016-14]
MDEVKKFLNIVKKYLLVLIIVPVITVIITYFLVRNLSDSYVSQVQIATGIVDETQQYQQQSILNQGVLPSEQANQEFNNLITMMKMKKMLDQISYKLIINDLTTSKPFRQPGKAIKDLNPNAKAHALEVYREMYRKKMPLNLWDKDQNGLFNVIKSVRYDSGSLSEKLNIYRSGSSDFIIVEFESEDPELSAFVVNSLSNEFVAYYSTIVKTNQVKATNFLGQLLKEKSDTLTKKMAALRTYKINNRVLNLDEQSKQLYSNIVDFDNKKQEAVQNTSSYAGALNEIDRKFSPGERRYIEAALSKVNQDIVGTKEELSALYDQYYKSDFDEKYKISIDSLQRQLTAEINRSSDQYINNPLATKQALIEQKLDLEVKLDVSRYSINALEREINKLNKDFDQLVPKEAEVQSYEMSIDIATKEYLDILNKYNQSSLESGISIKLNVVQMGMPGLAQPSKKMLLVILSGIITAVIVLLVLFVLFLIDHSILSAEELSNKTELPVIGSLSTLNLPSIDLKGIWKHDEELPVPVLELKNQLRSIRYEIENDLKGKVLVVNSMTPLQGKTFVAMSLAFAWMMTNKKVLVIDGNFSSPKISNSSNSTIYVEDFLQGKSFIQTDFRESSLVVLKNRGGDASLIEVASYEQIREKLDWAKQWFDLIIIETAALEVLNQPKEWISFADKVIGIFNYGQTIDRKKLYYANYLKNTGLFTGWVMNKVPEKK